VAARLPEFAQKRIALVQLSWPWCYRHLPLVAPHTVFMLDRKAGAQPVEQIAARMSGAARDRLQGRAARRVAR
jgi:EAL and modified HD-GYP domain-containing signal transduction protein